MRNRDISTGRFTAGQDVSQMGQSERQAYNDGMAARDAEISRTQEAAEQLKTNDALKQALFKAASLTGTKPIEQTLFDMGLEVKVDTASNELVLLQEGEEGQEALYTIPQQEYTGLQKLEALDTLCSQLEKLGAEGQAAAKSLRNNSLRDNNNVTF